MRSPPPPGRIAVLVAAGLALAFARPAGADPPRETIPLDEGWRFTPGGSSGASPAPSGRDGQTVRLPHTWNAIDTFDGVIGYRRGPGRYERRLPALPPLGPGGRILLEVDGASPRVEVRLNGHPLATRVEGWAGFVEDLTPALRATGENILLLEVDNSHDPDLAPGRKEPDYIVWGGLFRHARLHRVPAVHLVPRGISVRPRWRSGASAPEADAVEFLAEVRNDSGSAITSGWMEVSVFGEAAQAPIATARSRPRSLAAGETTLVVARMEPASTLRPWSPEDPVVHRARIELREERAAGPPALLDSTVVSFGLRNAQFDAETGFRLNGRPLKLRGFNRHEDYPGLGNALPASLAAKDAEQIRLSGGNFVRTSHYPQSPEFLEACDRLGILVLEEVTTWKHTGGRAWRRTIGRVMREMVRRDRTHPSIILWGMMNEGRSAPLFRLARAVARGQDPTRPVVYAEHKFAKALAAGTVPLTDVLGLNYAVDSYPGIHAAVPTVPLLSTEHTNASRTPRGDAAIEAVQASRVIGDLRHIEGWPFLAGGALWCMHDYATERRRKPDITIRPSGVLDAWRIPKEGWFAMRAFWSAEPAVHIEGGGSGVWAAGEGPIRTVRVYTNCDRVELSADGLSKGERAGEPIVTWEVNGQPGLVEARCRGEGENASHVLRRPGPPARVILSPDPPLLPSDSGEVSEIEVKVVDEAGSLVPDFRGTARLAVSGPGRLRAIAGSQEAPIAGGLGKAIVEAAEVPGEAVVTAVVEGLVPAEIAIEIR